MSDYIGQTITVSSCQSDISNQCRIKTPCTFGGGGGGGSVRERQIQSRKIENCGKMVPKVRCHNPPPPASKSNTSAQGTHRAPTRTPGVQAKGNCGKIAGNQIAGFCGITQNCGPRPPGMTCQLPRVVCCWNGRQHNRQHMQFTRMSEKLVKSLKSAAGALRKRSGR